jgi:TfoX/Sxy family transcriptional regulator of competence genes
VRRRCGARSLMGDVRRHSCMASSSDTVQFIVDQVGLGRRLSSKKMFGEFALYLDDKIVALVCDDQLFLKPTDQAKAFLGKVRPAPPYPGAKDYFLLTDELDDPDRLKEAVLITARALPDPKPKAAKSAKVAATGKQSSTRSKVPAKVVGKKRKS